MVLESENHMACSVRTILTTCCIVGVPVLMMTGCGSGKAAGAATKGPGRDMAIPVTIAKSVKRDVPIQADVIGSAEAISTVVLKPQISGQLLTANYREGDFVKAGQLLLTIDPRPLEAQLNQLTAQVGRDQAALSQAQANLARDRALEKNAKGQLDRAIDLQKEGIISREQYDQYVATAGSYAATIKADQAAVESAKSQIAASQAAVETLKVQLGYTKIYAPISGRSGSLNVKPGNVVSANNTEMGTIVQVEPIYVTFALPEVHLAALRKSGNQRLAVTAVPEEGGEPQQGQLAFFENTVDPATGTVKLKATFENKNHVLWPGQFVRVTLKLGEHPNAILVPSQAVQSGQDGTFVYVVKPDQKVDIKQVVASQRLGDESVIDKGLGEGETVVTEGALRLVPGSRVTVRERGAGGRGPGGGAAKGEGRPGAASEEQPGPMEGKRGGRKRK